MNQGGFDFLMKRREKQSAKVIKATRLRRKARTPKEVADAEKEVKKEQKALDAIDEKLDEYLGGAGPS